MVPWSRRLAPVWEEAYASIIRQPFAGDVLMAKADCTAGGQELCQKQHIHAFPTIKIYRRHNPHSHESYVGDRTHGALESFVTNNVYDEDGREAVAEQQSEVGTGPGEGCMMRGVVLVNRVPGNFHISAHSKSHSFQPHMLNMSHSVTSMSFGKALTAPMLRMLPGDVESGYDGLRNTKHYAAGQNTSLEHFLKVVHTSYEVSTARIIDTFQYTVNNNQYTDGEGLPFSCILLRYLTNAGCRARGAEEPLLLPHAAVRDHRRYLHGDRADRRCHIPRQQQHTQEDGDRKGGMNHASASCRTLEKDITVRAPPMGRSHKGRWPGGYRASRLPRLGLEQ